MRILIFGLPGSGKSTTSNMISTELQLHGSTVCRLNADEIRKTFDDWDFSPEGRLRQAQRMHTLSIWNQQYYDYVIADFVAPTSELRSLFNADFSIWMNTIEEGRFADTNKAWQIPSKQEYHVSFDTFTTTHEVQRLCQQILQHQ